MATSLPPRIDAVVPQAMAPAAGVRPRLLVVIYANPDYYPPIVNALKILRHHFQVTIIARNMGKPLRDWGDIEVIRVGDYDSAEAKQSLSTLSKLTELWRFCAAVRRNVAEREPDVMYAYDTYGFVSALRARHARRIPIIFQLHELPELKKGYAGSLQFWITKYALLRTKAASLIVFPEANRARIWRQAARDPRPALIVPNCSSFDFFSPPGDFRELARRRFAARRLLYIGWMSENNGQMEAVRALALTGATTTLALVGPHEDRFGTELHRLAENLAVLPRVQIDRWVPHPELAPRFCACAVGLSLYRPVSQNWEFNSSATNKLFEYAALGIPVVVPDRKSYREFFADDDWGIYANPEDSESL
ncbi:MAG: glycosyltransferase, partial [Candidatus Binataceae bacterium]